MIHIMNRTKWHVGVVRAVAIVLIGCCMSVHSVFAETDSFSSREVADIVRPTMVRLLQNIEGSVTIPAFIIDSQNKSVAIDPAKAPTVIENISENILGTGFFVSTDGHILTTAHFASQRASELVVIDLFIKNSIAESVGDASAEQVIDQLFTEDVVEFMLEQTNFDLQTTTIVLNPKIPNTISEGIVPLTQLGLVADTVYASDRFYLGEPDVALLKIRTSEGEHPSVLFSDASDFELGKKVYVFDAPHELSAPTIYDLDVQELYTYALQEAIVVKEKTQNDVVVYDTNLTNYLSTQGSLVFDENARILGIASYDISFDPQGEQVLMSTIIPFEEIMKSIDVYEFPREETAYSINVQKAIRAAGNGACKDAQAYFDIASASISQSVFANNTTFDSYIASCEKNMSGSNSREGTFGFMSTLQKYISSFNIWEWIIAIVMVMLVMSVLIGGNVIREKMRAQKAKKSSEHDYTPARTRSTALQQARRTPLETKLPLAHPKETAENAKTQTPKINSDIRSKNDTVPQESKSLSNHEVQKERKVKNEHVPQTNDDAPNQTASIAKKLDKKKLVKHDTSGHLETHLSESDQKTLKKLWPDKYGRNDDAQQTKMDEPVDMSKKTAHVAEQPVENVSEPGAPRAVIEYVKQTRALGFSDEEIKGELLHKGWKKEDVEGLF
jgi:S1-C subfamily serine protease